MKNDKDFSECMEQIWVTANQDYKMAGKEKIQNIPTWGKTAIAVIIALIFSVGFPTADTGTDIQLGAGLIQVQISLT